MYALELTTNQEFFNKFLKFMDVILYSIAHCHSGIASLNDNGQA